MKICHYYAQALHHLSGVTAAIDSWASQQASHGHEVLIISAQGPVPTDSYGVPVKTIRHAGGSRSTLVPDAIALARAIRGSDVLVLHEGWTLSHLVAAATAKTTRIPYVATPHGVYEPEILRSLRQPQRLRATAERLMLENAVGIHVYFDSEHPHVRRLAPRSRPFTAPTGHTALAGPSTWNRPRSGFLWFGRLDPYHKGLDILLRGQQQVPAESRQRIRLAGYDHLGGKAEVARMIDRLGLAASVTLEEPLDDTGKAAALAEAAAYIHPSRWECHSIAFLEAMESGAAVYVGSGCHISALAERTGAATVVPPDPSAWARILSSHHHYVDALTRAQFWEALAWDRSLAAFDRHLVMLVSRA